MIPCAAGLPVFCLLQDSFQLTFWIGAGRACRATWAADVVADVLTTLDAHAVFQVGGPPAQFMCMRVHTCMGE